MKTGGWLGGGYQLPSESLQGKVCIVTGANTGIGKETARGLADRGATVILACRSVERGQEAAKEIGGLVRVKKCDLASFASVRKFCEEVNREEKKVDILINNAGMVTMSREITEDGQEMQFQSNHLGHFLLTNLLLNKLKASNDARIVNVSSVAHWMVASFPWQDLTFSTSWYNGMSVYSITKLANIWFTTHLADQLQGTKVKVFAVHPGGVYTNLGRNISEFLPVFLKSVIGRVSSMTMLSPSNGAQTSLFCAFHPSLEDPKTSGSYYSNSRPAMISLLARDKDMAARLWEISTELVSLP